MTNILDKLGVSPFRPFPVVGNGWAQTIAAKYWPQRKDIGVDSTHSVELDDGDKLIMMENRPAGWRPGDRIVLMVHGLAGCYQSSYMIRMTRRFLDQGCLVMRLNLRGCGPGFGHAKLPYHSGRSEDTRQVLHYLKSLFPGSKVTQLGFSLGANITLKMAGEDGDRVVDNLDSFIAVSAPVDLAECAKILTQPKNYVFDQYFVKNLLKEIERLQNEFPDTEFPNIPKNINLTDFDDYYTAPQSGFKDAQDYYAKASSGPFVKNIAIPGLILHALDDPIVGSKGYERLEVPPQVDLVLTEKGGHVGYLGSPGVGLRWMDEVLVNWIKFHH